MAVDDQAIETGLAGARTRLEALAERLDRLTFEDLNHGPALRDPADRREPLRAAADLAAASAGRGDLLAEAVEMVRHATLTRFADRWAVRPYTGAVYPVARAEDQAAAVLALEDLTAATVARDLLEPAVARALGEPGERLLSAMGAGATSPANGRRRMPRRTGGHLRGGRTGPEDALIPGAPTAADWAAAARDGETARPRSGPGNRGDTPGMYGTARRLLPRLVGVAFGVTIGSWGLTGILQGGEGQPLVGVLGLVLAVVVGVTVARSNVRL